MATSAPRRNIQHEINSIEGTRFDKHGKDRIVQPTSPVRGSRGIPDVSVVHSKSCNNLEHEEDIE